MYCYIKNYDIANLKKSLKKTRCNIYNIYIYKTNTGFLLNNVPYIEIYENIFYRSK